LETLNKYKYWRSFPEKFRIFIDPVFWLGVTLIHEAGCEMETKQNKFLILMAGSYMYNRFQHLLRINISKDIVQPVCLN